MKKLLLSLALLLGLGIVNVNAAGYATFSTTNTLLAISSQTGGALEAYSVIWGSGSAVWGNSWFILVDSQPLNAHSGATIVTAGNTAAHGVNWTPAKFPSTQYITPKIMFLSTPTASGYGPGVGYLNLRDSFGRGRPVKNGLLIIAEGTPTGGEITVEYGRRERELE